jgi:Type IV secretion system pilin
MHIKKIKPYYIVIALMCFITPLCIHAATPNPTAFKDLGQVVSAVVNIVQVLLIMATTLYLLYAGLMFVTARGEPSKITAARDALLWGMVGAALILAARVLVTALQGGVNSILK